jgi:hypothetical protein
MNNLFRISLTEAGLAKGLFWVRGLPPPSVPPYRDHTVIVPKSDGSNREYGYKNVTILWDRMTMEAGYALQTLVEGARVAGGGTGLLYLTILRGDGSGSGRDWIDVSGRPGRVVLTAAPPFNRQGPGTYDNVTLIVNNLTIVNDPSSYS